MLSELLPPTYFIASICLMLGLHLLFPIAAVLLLPWRLGGLMAIAVGIWLNLAADRAFKIHDTTVKPFERSRVLLTEGVFRFTRNPMYLGMVLILFGIAMLLGTFSPFVVCTGFAVLLHFRFIFAEERIACRDFWSPMGNLS
jgi:protein-S-isoprenylcysteine O-methyltransferase Ste14